jgi:hypothetical protein
MGFMNYPVKMASYIMIYVPSFMKPGTDIQVILKFCLRNLKGCNVNIIDWRDL